LKNGTSAQYLQTHKEKAKETFEDMPVDYHTLIVVLNFELLNLSEKSIVNISEAFGHSSG
jgi:hypothetical protein